jgi:hypothetical protein
LPALQKNPETPVPFFLPLFAYSWREIVGGRLSREITLEPKK